MIPSIQPLRDSTFIVREKDEWPQRSGLRKGVVNIKGSQLCPVVIAKNLDLQQWLYVVV